MAKFMPAVSVISRDISICALINLHTVDNKWNPLEFAAFNGNSSNGYGNYKNRDVKAFRNVRVSFNGS